MSHDARVRGDNDLVVLFAILLAIVCIALLIVLIWVGQNT